MRTIIVHVSTGYLGSGKEREFEVDDDATEEEISEMALELMWEMVDYNWSEKE